MTSGRPVVMHPQLTAIAAQLRAATDRARTLVRTTDEQRFKTRPPSGGWSAAECLAHLNLTNVEYLPLLDAALAQDSGAPDASRRYRRDFAGWLLAWYLEPPVRVRVRTLPRFVPNSTGPRQEIIDTFVRLQGELERRLEAASGRDLNRLRIQSPFNARMHYNVYACFTVLASHERRHLWQAERALAAAAAAMASRA